MRQPVLKNFFNCLAASVVLCRAAMSQTSNGPDDDGYGKDDYYAMLNVPRNASTEEINRAFRQRSRVFHPDRHMDEQDKKEAEKFFVRLRKAHEALIDPHKRAIYDSVGAKGLNVAGWELITKTYNADDIKREYEFLRKLKDAETMLDRVQPSSTFCIKTNATDLFRSSEHERNWPEIVSMSMSQSADCAVSSNDRLTLRGHLKATNGRGGGGMTIGWRRPISDRFTAEGEVSFEEAPILALKLSRSFAKYIVAVQPMTIFHLDALSLRDAFEPGIGFIFTAQLSQRWRGTLMLRLGQQQSISTTLFYLDLNQPKFIGGLTITPALATSNIRLSYTHRMTEHEAFYRTTAAFGLFGVISSLTYERRLTRHSRISCSVRGSLPAGSLQTKFRLTRGVNSYEYDLILCDNQLDLPRATLYGIFVPLMVFHIGRLLLRPWTDDISAFFEGKIEDRQVDYGRKEDAIKETELMRGTAERIRETEEKKQGLIIVDAKYGEIVSDGAYDSDRSIDVTVALQSLVSDSKLLLYDAGKSQLPGFYDPCPCEDKLLRVLYRFRGDLHKVIVKDDQPLCIPKQSHRLV